MMAIENRIRHVINERGTTIYRVAKDTGLTYQTVHNLANPEKELSRIDMATLGKLCSYLNAEVGELFVYQRNESETPTPR